MKLQENRTIFQNNKMWSIQLVTVALISVAHFIQGAPEEDLVTKLPGLDKQPPFKQYSGYLNGDAQGDKFLHYWFVESSSNPRTDPVVLWLNGGPGCSSDLGILMEHGPFRIQDDGTTLKENPYSWNRAANMIYLESPAGVGFSYSKSGNTKTDDDKTANQNVLAVANFFDKFPEYKSNEFFITGESYGGVYVPTLAVKLLSHPSINLKGFGVGNGLLSAEDNDNSLIYFAYYHGLFGESYWNDLISNCCPGISGFERCNFASASQQNQTCSDKTNLVTEMVWSQGLDPYNLYEECAGGANTGFSTIYKQDEGKFVTTYFGWPFSSSNRARAEREKRKLIPKGMLNADPACANMGPVRKYLNTPTVREAIHASPSVKVWEPCSASLDYTTIYSTVAEFFEVALANKLRILVYNGDVDMACNFLGDEWFVNRLNIHNPSSRKRWYYKAEDGTRQIAGFVKTFDNLSLITVKGAGHQVPTDKPIPSLDMFINFIQNKPYYT